MRDPYFLLIFLIFRGINCRPIPSVTESDSAGDLPQNTPDSVNAATTTRKPPCDEEKLIRFLADIQVINPESIVEWAVDNLEPLCRKVSGNLLKITDYLQYCEPPQDDLYMSLIRGVMTLREKLCSDTDFINKFAIYYPCLHELRNDFEACNGPADWNEDPNKNALCKAYKHIVDCYYIKAAKVCGNQAAKTIKELMKDVVNSVVKIQCSGINSNPYVADPMPETYINRRSGACTVHMTYTIVIINVLILYVYQ